MGTFLIFAPPAIGNYGLALRVMLRCIGQELTLRVVCCGAAIQRRSALSIMDVG